jgi:hypothetical protein
MNSRQVEQLATQRYAELTAARAAARSRRTTRTAGPQRKPIRTQTGWALVSIGLRLAASGSR